MNERIRELWKQAAVRDDPDHAWTYDSDLHAAKFAELIIQECIDLVASRPYIDDGNWSHPSMMIKRHFGVEESKLEKFDQAMKAAFANGADLSGRETP